MRFHSHGRLGIEYIFIMSENTSRPLPPPPRLRKLLGPSFIILALGLGSGEVILWPYLSANYGLGLAWAALLGITFQFFINMEIERYALLRGESVFVGIHSILRYAPQWFILSTFIGFGLPGIIAASAQVLTSVVGIGDYRWVAAGLLILMGLILSIGKTVYTMMETFTRTVIFVGIPFIIVLAVALSSPETWTALASGLVGQGEGFLFVPPGIVLATFLAAFAYSGAGGNLNLTQSIYVKEKGFGMGAYAQKISGLFTGLRERQRLHLAGTAAEPTPENIIQFKRWWKIINLEHGLVFWGVGFTGIAILMVLAFETAFGMPNTATGIAFVITQGVVIAERTMPIVGTLFLLVVSIMLFQTQLGILDSTSRIMAENAVLARSHASAPINLSALYAIFVWAQIIFGITLFALGMSEPKTLIEIGAVLNAIAMFVHIGLVNYTNYRLLPIAFRPALWRKIVLGIIFGFFGFFSGIIIWDFITKLLVHA